MRYPVTVAGSKALQEELQRLKTIERPKIINAIAEARAHGDLKENAEYHAARDEQSFMEGRIKDLEAKLSNAQIVDITKIANNGKVIFGSTVKILNVETEEEITYQIVGEDEANIKIGKISYQSPIASSIIGKNVDDVISVKTPGGIVEYEVIDVQY
jgi:transcription elongation factor GreA